jgi:ubiquinone/menaquinone biosynthesis C-methylase UbiE
VKAIPPDYYVRMHTVEDRHWWHRGMRELELALLGRNLSADTRLLDAGCGTGGFLRFLLDRGAIGSAAGIDLSPEAIELARERVPEAELGVGSVTDVPFEDEMFDAAVLNDVLQHVPEDDVQRSLHELRRVLRPGSPLAVRTGGALHAQRERHDWRVYNRPALRRELERGGFAVERVTYANVIGSFAAAATGRAPRAPTEEQCGIPAGQSPLARAVGSMLLGAEARVLAWTPATLPYGHTLLALARRT